ncbi:hypothetical protein GPU20_01975 [Streptococcus thermophilus]|nr:hypothetical protein [Streptococcus thermophilus]
MSSWTNLYPSLVFIDISLRDSSLYFYLNHRKLQGQFDKHFYSSIPFILEEECRVGSALKDYLEKRDSI